MSRTQRNLDWRPYFDPRSKEYGIREVIRQGSTVPRPVMWEEGVVLDQGSEGACVGFAWTAELLTTPVRPETQPLVASANRQAVRYYKRAQKLDQWPGEDYSGTSVLAGAKVIKEEGLIESYRWCFSVEEIRDAVINEGPVVLGIPWYESMYNTTRDGLVTIAGPQVGGHAILITGYSPVKTIGGVTLEVFRWRNSWGESYGVSGSGYITVKDLRRLMGEGGEACVPMGRKQATFDGRAALLRPLGIKRRLLNVVLRWLDS